MEYIVVTDEWGKWHEYKNGVRKLIEPSQKWLDEHPAPEPSDEPTPDDDAITAEEALAILLGGEDE